MKKKMLFWQRSVLITVIIAINIVYWLIIAIKCTLFIPFDEVNTVNTPCFLFIASVSQSPEVKLEGWRGGFMTNVIFQILLEQWMGPLSQSLLQLMMRKFTFVVKVSMRLIARLLSPRSWSMYVFNLYIHLTLLN